MSTAPSLPLCAGRPPLPQPGHIMPCLVPMVRSVLGECVAVEVANPPQSPGHVGYAPAPQGQAWSPDKLWSLWCHLSFCTMSLMGRQGLRPPAVRHSVWALVPRSLNTFCHWRREEKATPQLWQCRWDMVILVTGSAVTSFLGQRNSPIPTI